MKTHPIAALLALALPLAVAVPALAQGTRAQQAACSGDAFRLCASSLPNADKVAACLRREKEQLSPACRSVFEAAESGGSAPGATAAKPEPATAAKDTSAAAPPADPAPPKAAATDKAGDPAPVAPPSSVAQAKPQPDAKPASTAARATPRSAASAVIATARPPKTRTVVRYVYVDRASVKRAASRQASASARKPRVRRETAEMVQARYWMKRITGVSIGNLAGLTP